MIAEVGDVGVVAAEFSLVWKVAVFCSEFA